jgi:hypothetical protein
MTALNEIADTEEEEEEEEEEEQVATASSAEVPKRRTQIDSDRSYVGNGER